MTAGVIQPNADLAYRLRRLATASAILHIGAHPDDEDAGMMAYASRGLGVRAVYWSATRGEGGQNRLGPERGEALGITRTWESLAARQVDGGDVLYGPFFDFGFAKTSERSFEAWGRDRVCREIVRAIRLVHPSVVVSRWTGGPSDGHGQHQAIGLAVAEAFDAAADPARYPDTGPAWRALKLYRSTMMDWQPGEKRAFGALDPEHETQRLLRIDTGAYDPVCGRTFQEQASIGLNRHRTQGMALVPEPGQYVLYYRLERSHVPVAEPERSFFDGLDPTLGGVAETAGIGDLGLRDALVEARRCAEEAAAAFHPERPAAAATAVLQGLECLRRAREVLRGTKVDAGRGALDALLAGKEGEFEDVAARLLGLRLECLLDAARVTPGGRVGVAVRLWSHGDEAVDVAGHSLTAGPGWAVEPSPHGSVGSALRPELDATAERSAAGPRLETRATVAVPDDAPPSTPYWLREPRTPYRYAWPPDGPLAQAFDPPLVEARCEVRIRGHDLRLLAGGVRREAFPGGYRELPLAVVPPVSLRPKRRHELLPVRHRSGSVRLTVEARCVEAGGAKGALAARAPAGWKAHPENVDLAFAGAGETLAVEFGVSVPPDADPGVHEIAYEADWGGRRPGVVVEPVRLAPPGLLGSADEQTCVAEAYLVAPAVVSVHLLDVSFVTTLRYGYVRGATDEVLPALAHFGLDMREISDDDLAYEDLFAYQAIIVGPNAYVVRDALRRRAGRVLAYVEAGGTLIVQHQGYGYEADGLAPYPLRFNRPHDRVTLSGAPVTVLAPEHPLMHVPNEISAADFDGWVHDRGMYFAGEWDARYEPLLACVDPGEEPRRGGLLVAAVGRGTYVYCAYSLFRQIPAGVPGGVRLFANLLGLAEGRLRERAARLRAIALFAPMEDAALHEIARVASERWLQPGEILARHGEPAGELYLVYDGEVEAIKGDRVVFVARPGDAIGELSVLTDAPRSATLRARGGARVLAVPGGEFRAFLRRSPDMTERVLAMLAGRLAGSEGPA